MRLVEVVPLTPVRTSFTYFINSFIEENLVGFRVLIPFGSRTLTGIVIKDFIENVKFNQEKLKGVIKVLDAKPILSENLIKLAFWISQYYFAPIGDVFKAMLPPGFATRESTFVQIAKQKEFNLENLSLNQRKIIEYLQHRNQSVSLSTLRNVVNISNFYSTINKLKSSGLLNTSRHIISKPKKQILIKFNLENFISSDFADILNEFRRRKRILRVLKLIYEKVIFGENQIFMEDFKNEIDSNANLDLLNQLSELGFISFEFVDSFSTVKNRSNGFSTKNELQLELNAEQAKIIEKVVQSIEKGKYYSFLLFGVKGSGKTLIYLNAIDKCLELGKTALVLVPEISLTPQLVERFETSFPNMVAVLHSHLPKRIRVEEWNSLIYGKKKIVIGARSAVFSPLKNLGLIIIDEEHDPSYKQEESDPRYNARDVALFRGRLESSVVILGSATPSVLSFYSAEIGKHRLIQLRNRADGASMPKIYIVDLLKAREEHQLYGQFSSILIEKIKERLRKKEGIIIFQNRRGFGLSVSCIKCGYVPKCPQCSVSLTFHKFDQTLKCHYCGFQIPFLIECSQCGNKSIKYFGYGTQRIEEEVKENLRLLGIEANVARFDLDIIRQNRDYALLLKKFNKGEIDILVGTQIIAKGLDFSHVTLVGIVNADLQINLPDYSSAERSFQLFTQVAGIAWRKSQYPGEVVIQTNSPNSSLIRCFVENDYFAFFRNEIHFRRQLLYPPFSRLITIEFQSDNEEIIKEGVQKTYDFLRNIPFITTLGPVTPIVPKAHGLMRRVLLLKVDKKIDPNGKKIYPLLLKVSEMMNKFVNSQKLRLIIDVDSQFSLY